MLRKKFKAIQNRNDKEICNQSVTIVLIKEKGAEKKLTEEEEENGGEDGDGDFRFKPAATDNIDKNDEDKDKAKPHCICSLEQHLGNFGDNVEAHQIHDDFHIHEEGLKRKTEQQQIKARRKTQVGLLFLDPNTAATILTCTNFYYILFFLFINNCYLLYCHCLYHHCG